MQRISNGEYLIKRSSIKRTSCTVPIILSCT